MGKHEFKECSECSKRTGAPVLCPICLSNRTLIEDLQLELKKMTIKNVVTIQSEISNAVSNQEEKDNRLCNYHVWNHERRLNLTEAIYHELSCTSKKAPMPDNYLRGLITELYNNYENHYYKKK